ncbi:MAG TPA: hypothetical protein VF192_03280 [Longimicrobiales bacterium]
MPAGAKTAGRGGGASTLELRVRNMSFLLERLGRDCAPDQFVRELTVNAVQAVQRAGGAGTVVWDHEPVYTRRLGAAKLCIADTGVGMTGPEMVEYINHLASSGGVQAEDGNFGVGAKIAAATRNPAGIVYLSWRRGAGAMVWLWRNPETGQYGLKRLRRAGGADAYWARAPDALKPALIGEHGTVVVLLGERESADTTLPPYAAADEASRALWLTRYLNGRFFELPAGVALRAREHWGTPRSRVRPVYGMKHFLELVSEASGRVRLPDATAHWWILPADVPEELAQRYPASGHVGALYQGELYELYTGRAGTAKLQGFGVAVGHQRVVLYVEPRVTRGRRVVPNTARTALLVDGRPLPWEDWAERFRENMPAAILALMEEAAGARAARDRTESFKQRMKGLANLLFIGGSGGENLRRLFAMEGPASRRDESGDDVAPARAGPKAAAGLSDARGDGRVAQAAAASSRAAPDDPAGAGDDRGAADRRDGEAARRGMDAGSRDAPRPDRDRALPELDLDRLLDLEVVWVSEAECGVADRAARYIPETNTLLMNRDFRVFAGYIERWRQKYAGNPAAQREVEDLVREWLEQPLRELVIRSHFLRGSPDWSEEHIRVLLSDEALTAVSLPCYLTEMKLRTALAQRLGRLRPAQAA